jgi:hypothetical protein
VRVNGSGVTDLSLPSSTVFLNRSFFGGGAARSAGASFGRDRQVISNGFRRLLRASGPVSPSDSNTGDGPLVARDAGKATGCGL